MSSLRLWDWFNPPSRPVPPVLGGDGRAGPSERAPAPEGVPEASSPDAVPLDLDTPAGQAAWAELYEQRPAPALSQGPDDERTWAVGYTDLENEDVATMVSRGMRELRRVGREPTDIYVRTEVLYDLQGTSDFTTRNVSSEDRPWVGKLYGLSVWLDRRENGLRIESRLPIQKKRPVWVDV